MSEVLVDLPDTGYAIVKSDGCVVAKIPSDNRYLVYSSNGLLSCRPLLDDEGVFNITSGTCILRRLGYRVTQPSDMIISTD